MTTEQFLSHLGIEVGQEFMCSGLDYDTKYKFGNSLILWWFDIKNNRWELSHYNVLEMLDEEITLLPKYILSEDEKAIVRLLPIDYKYMYRYNTGLIKVSSHSHIIEYSTHFSELQAFSHLFEFVGEKEEVSLDELRRCL